MAENNPHPPIAPPPLVDAKEGAWGNQTDGGGNTSQRGAGASGGLEQLPVERSPLASAGSVPPGLASPEAQASSLQGPPLQGPPLQGPPLQGPPAQNPPMPGPQIQNIPSPAAAPHPAAYHAQPVQQPVVQPQPAETPPTVPPLSGPAAAFVSPPASAAAPAPVSAQQEPPRGKRGRFNQTFAIASFANAPVEMPNAAASNPTAPAAPPGPSQPLTQSRVPFNPNATAVVQQSPFGAQPPSTVDFQVPPGSAQWDPKAVTGATPAQPTPVGPHGVPEQTGLPPLHASTAQPAPSPLVDSGFQKGLADLPGHRPLSVPPPIHSAPLPSTHDEPGEATIAVKWAALIAILTFVLGIVVGITIFSVL